MAQILRTSRTEAQDIIKAGQVELGGKKILKPGQKLSAQDVKLLTISGGRRAFVGRGGDKLEAALSAFNIEVKGRVCLDAGASTGGFTDCLLQRGAEKVYAIENGRGQLAAALQADSRVVSMEETDIRQAVPAWFAETITFAAVDVSFISLTKVLGPIAQLLENGALLLCLIKPQFEVGKGKVRRGIVRNPALRKQAVDRVCAFAQSVGFKIQGVLDFPQTPQKDKNQEFFAYCVKI